jgi:glutaredoxin-dependent peroxiredoxin
MKLLNIIALLLIASSFLLAQVEIVKGPNVGDAAPDFTLPYATKEKVSQTDLRLSSLFGSKNIVLAFYPADWSGGCTKEVCSIRDDFESLSKLNAEILAISGDYEYSHHEWAKFHNLPFKLVSDHDHAVAKEYVSYNPDNGFNKRTVYVIDKHGNISYIDLQYSVKDSTSFDKLKNALKKLQ